MKKLTTKEFIEKAKQIHGDEYDYSRTEYVNKRTKVCIICPKHGEFWQNPYSHITKHGCPICGNEKAISFNKKRISSMEEFINKARKIHNDKYDYSKVDYVNAHTKICIICSEHGEFWQTPNDHLNGYGCSKCANKGNGINGSLTTEEFIEKANQIHGDKYDYSKVEYISSDKKVCIICPKHGEFWQRPSSHIRGNGCCKCHESKLEKEVEKYLLTNKIKYLSQYREKWLKRLTLDFYLPDYNIAIECQGEQHFKPVNAFGGEEEFEKILERDMRKKELCEMNNIKLFYFIKNNIKTNISCYTSDNMINDLNKLEI